MRKFIIQGGENNEPADLIEPIKNEFHQRLRFTRRGLVGMATNEGSDNNMQFFFTLDQTPELQNTHTIFGKITGETIYNALKLGDTPTDHNERPLNPHKINKVKILHNPFSDITPRVDRIKSSKDDKKDDKKKREGVKNFKLISFGDEAEQDEMEVEQTAIKKSSEPTPAPSTSSSSKKERKEEKRKRSETPPLPTKSSKEKSKSNKQVVQDDSDSDYELSLEKEKQSEIDKKKREIQQQIKDIKRQYQKDKKGKNEPEEDSQTASKPEKEVIQDYLDEKEKYKKQKETTQIKGNSREAFTLKLLEKFKNKLHDATEKSESGNTSNAVNSDDDENWLGHKLDFSESADAVLAKDASKKADDWYDIYDPRNPINKRKRGAENEAKKLKK